MTRYIVDRIEGEYAVCETEDGQMENVALKELPETVTEGDLLVYEDGKYRVDPKATTTRKAQIQAKVNDLFVD